MVASWTQRLATEESEEGFFANQWICERGNEDLTVDQAVSLSRTNRRWTMQAVFKFRNDRPRAIWVEVPTIWTEDISVLGGEILQKVPAIEESRTVLKSVYWRNAKAGKVSVYRGGLIILEQLDWCSTNFCVEY